MKHRLAVSVIGAGHAGVEAARAAAAIGADVLLFTHRRDRIGELSCNPAIGGLGKTHLVSEVDALGGLMARLGDAAAIHYRMLNRSKGPATQGVRVQADRSIYRRVSRMTVAKLDRVRVIEAGVDDILVHGGQACGVVLGDGCRVLSDAVVVTAGTFLAGAVHVGNQSWPGGRIGDVAAGGLAGRLRGLGLAMGRLKTGTPPRISRGSIDWRSLEPQESDKDCAPLSFLRTATPRRTVDCAITETNARTHDIIRRNLGRSALYGGHIAGIGPRYCPSIEDKVTRFAEKDSHRVFLEPEGLRDPLVYPNGISTSLPADVQVEYIRSIRGLERAEIVRPGYAIEYDYLDPRALDVRLCSKDVSRLYFAGQVNGTTGYEEAAAQGLMAGANAALAASGAAPLVLARHESYIGVMIDDLTTLGVSEPYRMFTSRAEHRLSLRTDNADQRLTPRAIEFGLASPHRARVFEAKQARLAVARHALSRRRLTGEEADRYGVGTLGDGSHRSAMAVLALDGDRWGLIAEVLPDLSPLCRHERRTLHAEAVYAGYIEREQRDVALLGRSEAMILPTGLDYASMAGLSTEIREKLSRARPATLGQAARIEGVTPAALILLAGHAQRPASNRP